MCFVQQFPVTMFTTVRHSAVLPPSQSGPYLAPDCLQLQLDLINCHLPMWHCNAGCKTNDDQYWDLSMCSIDSEEHQGLFEICVHYVPILYMMSWL